MKGNYIGIIIVAFLLVAGSVYVLRQTYEERLQTAEIIKQNQAEEPITYLCENDKTFTASFSEVEARLMFPDGSERILPIAISGSGFRYENASTTFIGKGADAYLEETGKKTYANCVENAAHTDAGTNAGTNTYRFSDNGKTIQFNYPKEFTISGGGIGYSTDWQNQSSLNGLVLVVAQLPRAYAPNTNFSGAKFTIGTSADEKAVATCLTAGSANTTTKPVTVTIHSSTYTKLITNDAGAGNLYETTSYRTVRNGQCYTIEYTIHSTNIGNYSPDQGVTEFSKVNITEELERLVQSVKFL